MTDVKALNGKAVKLGKQICRMCTEAGSGHPSSALSLLHLTTALMYRVMRYDVKDPWHGGDDRVVLSEGHAVPVIYAAYCELGGLAGTKADPVTLTFDDALTLRRHESLLDGHPNPARGFPFFDAATGSLGQGLSVAAGLAAAAKVDGLDRRFYCMIGDGESREGQIWEAVDFIVDHSLTAVRMIFNCNGQGQSDYVSGQQSAETLAKKLAAYNCDVKVIDGHDWDEVLAALEAEPGDKPIAIVAKTVKGWGSRELQSKNYHGKPLGKDVLEQTLKDFDELAKKLGVSGDDGVVTLEAPGAAKQESNGQSKLGPLGQACEAVGLGKAYAAKKMATRQAYGVALAEAGRVDERVVALDGDVKNSTFTEMFAKAYPERYFEARIAEQNMISAGAGMAAAGKVPFVSSFAKFLVRGYDQIELAVVSNANLKLCGSHAGASLGADGPSQMGLVDVAFARTFARSRRVDGQPACRMYCPSDAVSAYKLTEQMLNTEGMCYMRTLRPGVEFLYSEDETFGPEGFKPLSEGTDVTVVASGYMVHVAKKGIAALDGKVSVGLVDAYALPLDTGALLKLAGAQGGRVLVVEDNYVGGFADEIACAAAADGGKVQVKSLYVQEVPKSALDGDEVLATQGLGPADIAAAVLGLVGAGSGCGCSGCGCESMG